MTVTVVTGGAGGGAGSAGGGGHGVSAGGGGSAGGSAAAGGTCVDACGAVCFEADTSGAKTTEHWAYVGSGRGSYTQVETMELVGQGKGDFIKEQVVVGGGGVRCRAACMGFLCVLCLAAIIIPLIFLLQPQIGGSPGFADINCATLAISAAAPDQATICCQQGHLGFCADPAPLPSPPLPQPVPEKVVIHDKYYTRVKEVPVPHMVPVPIPSAPAKIIEHKVFVKSHAYDCNEGLSTFASSWSAMHQRYCCYLHSVACHTQVKYRNHYHTITSVKHVGVPVHVPIPAPPAAEYNRVVNMPIHDPPQVIQVKTPGHTHVVNQYVHSKHYVPEPVPSPPRFRSVPVPVPVHTPGKVIPVPSPLPPQTVVHNKVVYKTRHVITKNIYDCDAGFNNWKYGWSSPKKTWCCAHENKGCPGTWTGSGLTKTIVTGVTTHHGQYDGDYGDYGHYHYGHGGHYSDGGSYPGATTHSYHVHYSSGGGGGGGAAGGGSWHSGGGSWSSSGGVTHHYHVHHDVHVIHDNRGLDDLDGQGFDCTAAHESAWPQEKRDFCCKQDPSLCE